MKRSAVLGGLSRRALTGCALIAAGHLGACDLSAPCTGPDIPPSGSSILPSPDGVYIAHISYQTYCEAWGATERYKVGIRKFDKDESADIVILELVDELPKVTWINNSALLVGLKSGRNSKKALLEAGGINIDYKHVADSED